MENISLHFTVAIPTYNGETRLPLLLEKLRSQVVPHHITWEIIVIDNNSTDNTFSLIQNYQTSWNCHNQLRYVMEKEQGAAFARLRAVHEARGELIGFLDDDNLPAFDWITAAYAFSTSHPQAGAFGSQIHADYAIKPPDEFKRIESFLAIRERGSHAHLYQPENLSLPPSAGLVVRKKAWCTHVPNRPTLSGKISGSMIQGEDYEVLLYLHKAGWEIWYNPAMHIDHQIPHWRLEKDYLVALARGCGLPICQLRLIGTKNWQKPLLIIKITLGSFWRLLQHFMKHKWKIKTDLIAFVEMHFYLSSFFSTFYYLKNRIVKHYSVGRSISKL